MFERKENQYNFLIRILRKDLKKVEEIQRYNVIEDNEGDKNGTQLVVKGLEVPKELSSDSPTVYECVLLI